MPCPAVGFITKKIKDAKVTKLPFRNPNDSVAYPAATNCTITNNSATGTPAYQRYRPGVRGLRDRVARLLDVVSGPVP